MLSIKIISSFIKVYPGKCSSLQAVRLTSSGSHSDFHPVKKSVPNDMDEVLTLIGKQVKENPIMLYMKGLN